MFSINKTKRGVRSVNPQDMILKADTPFLMREAYKALRSNVIFSLPDQDNKRLIVTSAIAGEGKSTTCLNLAISFTEIDAKVIIVDCDLRKPNLAFLLNQKVTPGLSNYLVRMNTLEQVIRPSGYKGLDFIAAGDLPPNPAELLSSNANQAFLEELSKRYDYVFLDTPPLNAVTDASILSRNVTGVILVVAADITEKEELSRAVQQLNFAQADIIGTVYNRAETRNKKKSYYYYYGPRNEQNKLKPKK